MAAKPAKSKRASTTKTPILVVVRTPDNEELLLQELTRTKQTFLAVSNKMLQDLRSFSENLDTLTHA